MSEQYPWEDETRVDSTDEQDTEDTQGVQVEETTRSDPDVHEYSEV